MNDEGRICTHPAREGGSPVRPRLLCSILSCFMTGGLCRFGAGGLRLARPVDVLHGGARRNPCVDHWERVHRTAGKGAHGTCKGGSMDVERKLSYTSRIGDGVDDRTEENDEWEAAMPFLASL